MSWNDGNGDNQDPWDRHKKRKSQQPPNLDEFIASLNKKFAAHFSSKSGRRSGSSDGSTGNVIGISLLCTVLLLLWGLSGIFIVAPAEQSVVLRFGRYHETLGMGPHWIPRFIDTQRKVNVEKISTFNYDSDMLTSDENIVHVEVSVQYRVGDPRSYLYNVVNPENSLAQATASALRQVVGDSTLAREPSILTTGRDIARQKIEQQLEQIVKQYNTGIEITDVKLQNARPPEQVMAAFDDAIKAREDEQRYINQAMAYKEKVVPIAEGNAKRVEEAATAYKQQVTLNAQADVAKFLAILPERQRAPKITDQRLYLSAMEHLYAQTDKILVDTPGANNLMYLPLDKIIQGRHTNSSK